MYLFIYLCFILVITSGRLREGEALGAVEKEGPIDIQTIFYLFSNGESGGSEGDPIYLTSLCPINP